MTAGADYSRHVLGLWFDVYDPGGPRLGAIDRLAQTAEGRKLARFAAMLMVETGFKDESVHAASYSYKPIDGSWESGEAEAFLKQKFGAGAATYDEIKAQRLTAAQFTDFLFDSVPVEPHITVLDVGCGTGLVGERLLGKVGVLDGIDLCEEMVAKARSKNVYDRLVVAEAAAGLAGCGTHDLILCNWCLLYMPRLDDFFAAAARALSPGGQLVLTVYACGDAWDALAMGEREFAHSRPYLRRLAKSNGLAEDRMEIRVLCASPGYFCVFDNP
jgi:predicted TPR repeat methyltransferase